MMPLILIIPVFWVGIGIATLQNEMKSGNKKLLKIPFRLVMKILAKTIFYGPFTAKKVLPKL